MRNDTFQISYIFIFLHFGRPALNLNIARDFSTFSCLIMNINIKLLLFKEHCVHDLLLGKYLIYIERDMLFNFNNISAIQFEAAHTQYFRGK